MADKHFRITTALFIFANFKFGDATSDIIVQSNGNFTLQPNVQGPPEDILWRWNKNKVVEFDQKEMVEYGQFKGRTTLDLTTGALTLTHLTEADSGEYVGELQIKGNLVEYRQMVKVFDAVGKSAVTCQVNGPSVTLLCSGGDRPSTQYRWEGPAIEPQPGSQLKIEAAESSDAVYTCVLHNPVGESRTDFPVKSCFPAPGKPAVTCEVNGSSVTLLCSGGDRPSTQYRWEGPAIEPQPGSQLKIEAAESSDAIYTCVLHNPVGESRTDFPVKSCFPAPDAVGKPAVTCQVNGPSVTLLCSGGDRPSTQYRWEGPAIEPQPGSQLKIEAAESSDAIYTCVLHNPVGESRTDFPVKSCFPAPDAVGKPAVICQVNGPSVTLLCSGGDRPSTQYRWEGPAIQPQPGSQLKIEAAESSDAIYTCVLHNPVGESRTDFPVKSCFPAPGKPAVTCQVNGPSVTLLCSGGDRPSSQYRWEGPAIEPQPGSQLKIEAAESSDAVYTCVLHNPVGESRTDSPVKSCFPAPGKPAVTCQVNGPSVTLLCSGGDRPSTQYRWEGPAIEPQPGSQLKIEAAESSDAIYTCVLHNPVGESRTDFPVKSCFPAPDAVGKPAVTCQVNGPSVTLLCSGGNRPSTQYRWEGLAIEPQPGSQLKIEAAESSDAVYTCVLHNPVGESRTDFPVKSCFPAPGDVTPDIIVQSNGNFTLQPNVQSPPEDILWTWNENKVVEFYQEEMVEYGQFKRRTILDLTTGALTLTNLTEADSGEYVGELQIKGNLVKYRQVVKVFDAVGKPAVTCQVNGSSVTLLCSGGDRPSTQYRWEGPAIDPQPGSQLKIEAAESSDAVYTCVLHNPVGESRTDFPVKSCFPAPGSSSVVISVVLVLFLIFIIVGLLLFYYKKFYKKKTRLRVRDTEAAVKGELQNSVIHSGRRAAERQQLLPADPKNIEETRVKFWDRVKLYKDRISPGKTHDEHQKTALTEQHKGTDESAGISQEESQTGSVQGSAELGKDMLNPDKTHDEHQKTALTEQHKGTDGSAGISQEESQTESLNQGEDSEERGVETEGGNSKHPSSGTVPFSAPESPPAAPPKTENEEETIHPPESSPSPPHPPNSPPHSAPAPVQNQDQEEETEGAAAAESTDETGANQTAGAQGQREEGGGRMEVVIGAELSSVGQEGEELRTQQQMQPRSSPAVQRKRRIFWRVIQNHKIRVKILKRVECRLWGGTLNTPPLALSRSALLSLHLLLHPKQEVQRRQLTLQNPAPLLPSPLILPPIQHQLQYRIRTRKRKQKEQQQQNLLMRLEPIRQQEPRGRERRGGGRMEVVIGAELSSVGQEGEELRTQQQMQPRSSPAAQRKRRRFRRVRKEVLWLMQLSMETGWRQVRPVMSIRTHILLRVETQLFLVILLYAGAVVAQSLCVCVCV
ncbi:hemicentin-2-like isoform X2 [Anguilla anguilla]|uniref:hemicentin-2-like isoform X2 n=1 Tax=Anguilla anguilla TaxID=7936 RepID=UPI0015B13072|nr:hemicentin-2-like isoform X2 [Anguilla anguilla]